MKSALEQLKEHTIVVCDTGDFEQLSKYKPQDSTTNPTLILAAAQQSQYKHLIDNAIEFARANAVQEEADRLELAMDKLAVNFGIEILKIIPGRVSTEIDARLSFDTERTVKKGKDLIRLYKEAGISSDRVLLKIASTWEGLQAARILEAEGLHCNMTLLFSVEQAALAGEVGATLISPFAGRITDYYKQKEGRDSFPPSEDPGVISVVNIYNYMRKFGYKTVVMGASFRTAEQVVELCGCDLLTVSPQLLKELAESHQTIERKLSSEIALTKDLQKLTLNEGTFKFLLNDNEMALVKLSDGIRRFAADTRKLEGIISHSLTQKT